MNLFVACIISAFANESETFGAKEGLKKNERKCLSFCVSAEPARVYHPTYRAQLFLYKVVQHRFFEYFILTTIFANSITLLMLHDGMSSNFEVCEIFAFLLLQLRACALAFFCIIWLCSLCSIVFQLIWPDPLLENYWNQFKNWKHTCFCPFFNR